MPWLYHHYAGHDNNRDFFQANLVETQYWMELMYHRTYPQLYLDQHQMGSSGPRIFVPPYPDPMNPDVHPLQWQQLRFMGGGMVADLQAQGKQGVVTGSMYRIWGQEGALTGALPQHRRSADRDRQLSHRQPRHRRARGARARCGAWTRTG